MSSISQSCDGAGVGNLERAHVPKTCNSSPFLKPTMTVAKVLRKCKDLIHNSLTTSSSLRVTADLSLDESKEALTELAKQLKPVGQSTVSCDTSGPVPDKAWESLKEAKTDITLDLKTGNPTLWTSKDGRRLRSFTQYEAFHDTWPQRDPNKYDGWLCIQGSQGFISGRHYWEVDVKKCCDWRIGVVRDSAPRHGFAKLTVASGYWTLRLQLGNLMALTSPTVTKLNRPAPTRIGIFLDMDAKMVVFFDAKNREHIFTFQADFREHEKIYPVFGTVETNRELVII